MKKILVCVFATSVISVMIPTISFAQCESSCSGGSFASASSSGFASSSRGFASSGNFGQSTASANMGYASGSGYSESWSGDTRITGGGTTHLVQRYNAPSVTPQNTAPEDTTEAAPDIASVSAPEPDSTSAFDTITLIAEGFGNLVLHLLLLLALGAVAVMLLIGSTKLFQYIQRKRVVCGYCGKHKCGCGAEHFA